MAAADQPPVATSVPGEEDLGLVDALAQLTFVVHGALARITAGHEMSVVQVRLLGILRDRRPTITVLAQLLGLDKTSVTKLVDRAEERGLVRRTPSPLDGRSVLVSMTAAGKKTVDRAASAFEAEIAELVADLSPAQRSRLSALATLVVASDARRRGIDVFDVAATGPSAQGPGSTSRSR
jgi:MarR family transcriptional regulator, lower aerobic nicotinate degradation pathway regulator